MLLCNGNQFNPCKFKRKHGVLQQHQPATDLAASTDKPAPALTPDLATSAHHPPSSIDPSTADERAFGIHWMLLR